jgi:hypothetical protein
MSFFTCFWLFPQNEHFSRSESPNFAMAPYPSNIEAGPTTRLRAYYAPPTAAAASSGVIPLVVMISSITVLLGLLGREDVVAIGVLRHLVQRLSRVLRDQLLEQLAVARDLLRLDLDVHRLPLRTAVRLVQ